MKAVKVEWIDSTSDNGRWCLSQDVDIHPVECITLGFIVEDNDRFITLAQTLGKNPEQFCQMICIPKSAIRNMIVIDKTQEK